MKNEKRVLEESEIHILSSLCINSCVKLAECQFLRATNACDTLFSIVHLIIVHFRCPQEVEAALQTEKLEPDVFLSTSGTSRA